MMNLCVVSREKEETKFRKREIWPNHNNHHPATQPNDRQQPQTQQQASIEPLEEKTDKNASGWCFYADPVGQLVLVRAYEVAEDVKAMMHRYTKLL